MTCNYILCRYILPASLCCKDNRRTQFGLCSDAGIDNWHLVVGSGDCNRALVRGSHRSDLITPATLLSQQVDLFCRHKIIVKYKFSLMTLCLPAHDMSVSVWSAPRVTGVTALPPHAGTIANTALWATEGGDAAPWATRKKFVNYVLKL